MRIDKLLGELGYGTRTELKKALKTGAVRVNDQVIRDGGFHVAPEDDRIEYRGTPVVYRPYEYFVLHKPQGYVCARKDNVYPTVMELITTATRNDLSPVGRLDQDTEGLLLITNDGQLAHKLLSPKKHVDKTYLARLYGIVNEDDIRAFAKGLDIGDEKLTLPADLEIRAVDTAANTSEAVVTIREGRYHQVKRMFQAVGKEVTYLKRLTFGSLTLDSSLGLGEYRELTAEEVKQLKE